MKCSRLNCGHGIGLVSYQRHWFDKRRFCSKKCRDDFTVERPSPSQQERTRRHLLQLATRERHVASCFE